MTARDGVMDGEKLIRAASSVDWGQVHAHGGSPCFRVEKDGRFCLRADRWPGHQGENPVHLHEPLYVAMTRAVKASAPPRAQADLDALAAEVLDALDSAWAAMWDGHYSKKGVTAEYARDVDRKVHRARSLLSEIRRARAAKSEEPQS